MVTAGWDNCVRVWDVHSGENKTTLVSVWVVEIMCLVIGQVDKISGRRANNILKATYVACN